MVVSHTDSISGHHLNLNEFAIRAWLDVCEAGFGWSRYQPFKPTDSAVYVTGMETEGPPDLAGIIVYNIDEDRRAHIQIGYVLPAYRGQGAYSAMYKYLIENVEGRGVNVIESIIHPDNTPMMSLAQSQERDIVGYIMRHNLRG